MPGLRGEKAILAMDKYEECKAYCEVLECLYCCNPKPTCGADPTIQCKM